jgi:hypothetical protein
MNHTCPNSFRQQITPKTSHASNPAVLVEHSHLRRAARSSCRSLILSSSNCRCFSCIIRLYCPSSSFAESIPISIYEIQGCVRVS